MSDNGLKGKTVIVSTAEISEMLGLTDRRIRQLENDDALVKIGRGKFDLKASIQRYVEYIKEQAEQTGEELNLTHEKTLLTRANREKVELELQIMRGELHRSTDVRRVMNDMLGAFRARMLALPSKTAPQLLAQTELAVVQDVIKKEVYEALRELADYNPAAFYAHSKDTLVLEDDKEGDPADTEEKKEQPRNVRKKAKQ